MKPESKKFLEFNGKTISLLYRDGQYWIAIRPICQALNVRYAWQYKMLKKHPILADVLYVHIMRDTKNRLQKMVALPEKYIYGWLFQIKSKNPDLLQYQYECFEIIYNHFHGSITGRRNDLIRKKVEVVTRKTKALLSLNAHEGYTTLNNLEAEERKLNRELRKLDQDILEEQLSIFNSKQ